MFVIYHIASTMHVGPTKNGHPHTLYACTYKTRHHAAATCAKFNAKTWSGIGPGPYGFCTVDHYQEHVVRMVERTNLLSGKKFTEASNTPAYCSPSSEAYWSM